jgi:hypothetical protein
MTQPSIGIITPSYPPDFERCRLLVQSVQRHLTPLVTHFLVVKREDAALFSALRGANVEIVIAEDILPWWLQKIPLVKNGWVSFRGALVRNWILQQIVKLSIARAVNRDVLAFFDSDVALVRPFDIRSFIRDDRVRLFRVAHGNRLKASDPTPYSDIDLGTCRALQLPLMHVPDNYEGQIITWRRDRALELHNHIARVHGTNWVEALTRIPVFYEYFLYGVFVDHVLQTDAGHFHDDTNICLAYWKESPMADAELHQFFDGIKPSQVAIMISSKSGIPASRYESMLDAVR